MSMYKHVLALILFVYVCWFGLAQAEAPRSSSPSRQPAEPKVCSLDYQFDYYVFSLVWPRSICYRQQCVQKLTRKQTWNIHGLWQNKRRSEKTRGNSSDSSFCCGPRFNVSLLNAEVLAEMRQKWPTLVAKRSDPSFWAHEFNKHGSCVTREGRIKNVENYFRAGLGLYNQYDLNTLNFKKGDEVNIDEIHRLIESKTGKKVKVKCLSIPATQLDSKPLWVKEGNTMITTIAEVHMCFDKSLSTLQSKPIDCPARDANCRGKIIFP